MTPCLGLAYLGKVRDAMMMFNWATSIPGTAANAGHDACHHSPEFATKYRSLYYCMVYDMLFLCVLYPCMNRGSCPNNILEQGYPG